MTAPREAEAVPPIGHPQDLIPTLAAVLFDMDGTLLDSEKVWDRAIEDLVAHLGGTLSTEVRQSMVGSSLWRSIAIVHNALGVSASPDASARYLTDRTAILFRTDLVWKPGARELLNAVAAQAIPAALVTSTYRELTEIALDFIGRDRFAVTVCGDEVSHPKPAPEPYLRAAQLLDVDAGHCVAIEDSPLGIASAVAAGCAVVAVPSEVPIAASAGVTVVDSLCDVDLQFLRKLL
jgi:HAD superfamily hydrolase (TIGR01509 family)